MAVNSSVAVFNAENGVEHLAIPISQIPLDVYYNVEAGSDTADGDLFVRSFTC